MGESNIGWTDVTWNPVTGCSHISPGCEHCYAETMSLRRGWSKKPWTKQNALQNVILHPDRLEQPLHWRKPRMVFVNSMSDLFHELVGDDFLDRIFGVMAVSSAHTFQALTKRPERMLEYLDGLSDDYDRIENAVRSVGYTARYEGIPLIRWPIPNVWLGTSVEDQRRADDRIMDIVDTPAAVRWLSCEPLLGPILFPAESLDWVVVGGESGPGHRSMRIEWLESIVAQCRTAGIPVFVKQDSGGLPGKQGRIPDELWALKQFPDRATP